MPDQIPPLSVPWQLLLTPEVLDSAIVEIIDSTNTGGQYNEQTSEGEPAVDTAKYPGHLLVESKAVSFNRVQRTYSTEYHNQDVFAYDIGYSGESNNAPIYVRRYLIRRDRYSAEGPLPKGTNMTGVWQVIVTDGGSGYDPAVPPVVTLTPVGLAGSGATAVAFVDSLGAVRWIRVTAEGTGYTNVPAVSVAAPLSGVTATATAVIQKSVTNTVASVTIDDPGSGYLGIPPLVVFSSGDAQALAEVDPGISGGHVVGVKILNGGRDYVVPPGVTFTPQGLGSGAVGTAVLEELSLTCVKEDVAQLPQDDPRMSLFVLVTRVFETTPGPVLVDWKYSQRYRRNVKISKRIVLSSSVPASSLGFPAVVNGTVTEYQSTQNSNRSIQIVSTIGTTLPDQYVFYSFANYRFPDQLIGQPTMAWVQAGTFGEHIAIDFGLDNVNIYQGYAGPVRARVIRNFTYTPNEAYLNGLKLGAVNIGNITIFSPQAHTFSNIFGYDTEGQQIAQVRTYSIPQSLHRAMTIPFAPGPGGGNTIVAGSIPATTPISLPPAGTWITIDITPTLDETLGIWQYDVLQIQVPQF